MCSLLTQKKDFKHLTPCVLSKNYFNVIYVFFSFSFVKSFSYAKAKVFNLIKSIKEKK